MSLGDGPVDRVVEYHCPNVEGDASPTVLSSGPGRFLSVFESVEMSYSLKLHVLVGMYCMFNGEGGDARRHFDRAIQLEPRQNQLTTLCQLSSALVRMRESKNDQPVNLPKPTNLVLRAMVDIARGIDAIYKSDYALAK